MVVDDTLEVALSLAEITAKHLQAALSGGTITTSGGTTVFQPPALGAVTPVIGVERIVDVPD